MYCPRCGAQNLDTTKFCRQCGLSLQQVVSYVATGGTGSLTTPPPVATYNAPPPVPLQLPNLESSDILALRQKRILTILSICIFPIFIAILANSIPGVDDLAGLPFLFVPIGITWAMYHFKIKIRKLEEEKLQQLYAQFQQPGAPTTGQPMFSAQSAPQLPSQITNPLSVANPAQGSVIEDETRKFPIKK